MSGRPNKTSRTVQGVMLVTSRSSVPHMIVALIPRTPEGIVAHEQAAHQLRMAHAPFEVLLVPSLRMYVTTDGQAWFVYTPSKKKWRRPEAARTLMEGITGGSPAIRTYLLPRPNDRVRIAALPNDLPPQVRARYLTHG